MDTRENEYQILIGLLQNSLLSERLKAGTFLEKMFILNKPINSLATIVKLAMKDPNSMVYITLLEYLAKNKRFLQPYALELFPLLIPNLHSDQDPIVRYSVLILEECIIQNWIKIAISLPVINLNLHKLNNSDSSNLWQLLSKINISVADSHDREIFYQFYPKLFKIKPKIPIEIILDILLSNHRLDKETCNFYYDILISKKIVLDIPYNIRTKFYQIIATHFWVITQINASNLNLKYVELINKSKKYQIYGDIGNIYSDIILKEVDKHGIKTDILHLDSFIEIKSQNNHTDSKYIRCSQCNMETEINGENNISILDDEPKYCAFCGNILSDQIQILNE